MASKKICGAPIANPYAKKRRVELEPKPPSAANNAPFSGGSTFSQAFQTVDETKQYKKHAKNAGIASDPNVKRMKAEQRLLDMNENQRHMQQQKQQQLNNISDKDHHQLLQPHMLYVSTKQRGNGVLKHIRNVPFAFSKMVPDYIMSPTSCALFLSIKYHQLYSNYIHRRLGELKSDFKVRILLVLVDVEDNAKILLQLNAISVRNSMTMILAWTEKEAARYLESYKALNGKDASIIQRKEANNYVDQVAEFITATKPANKTDSANLLCHFSNVQAIIAASKDELSLCPGLGHVKVQKLHDAFHHPFSTHAAAKLKKRKLEEEKETEDKHANS
ncbi:unnamed protein product [Cylindrotheca closterium]|uniref:ERCC1-like central domain-containing protein n=1 Tax=Cylindrotheca closterium TaxID=2856 RepID=A0AAD2PVZ4_9STRA|nr:unnamed protein product [Cylindrotheca closterium]